MAIINKKGGIALFFIYYIYKCHPAVIWFASTGTNKFGASDDVDLFASLTDPAAEGTGIYFSPFDAGTLYVNIQHSTVDDGDATWAITKQGRGHWKKFDY